MAKKSESLEDLDAEIARLEAELEALEDGLPASAARKRKPRAPRAAAVEAEEAPEAQAPEVQEAPAKRGLKLPFGRRGKAAPDAEASPAEAPAGSPGTSLDEAGDGKPRGGLLGKLRKAAPGKSPEGDAAPEPGADAGDDAGDAAPPVDAPPAAGDGEWRREDGVWKRVVPDAEAPTFRRVLDADGNVVSEEPATDEDVKAARANGGPPVTRKVLGFLKRRDR